MFLTNFFNRKNIQEEFEYDEKQVEDIDKELDEKISLFDSPIYIKKWSLNNSDIDIKYFFLEIRKIIPYLSTWSFNRKINNDHKNNLKRDLLEQKIPHFMGSLQVASDKNSRFKIMNGQHRLFALREIICENIDMNFDMIVPIELYELNILDIENPDEVEKKLLEDLFTTANKSLNFLKEDNIDNFCSDIILECRKDPILGQSIKDQDIVYRPRINSKEFYENLKEFLPKEIYKKSVKEVVNLIKQKNLELSLLPPQTLFKNITRNKFQYDKAIKYKFFLNLGNSNFTPNKWIASLN